MAKLMRVTTTIVGDEKSVGLYEVNEQSPGNRGMHRYQLIYVVRDGELAEFRVDMGLAKNWVGTKQLFIPGLLEHTVDELKDLADELRWDKPRIDEKDFLELDHYKKA